MQQPPRGGTWVGSTCDISETHRLQVLPSKWLRSSRFFQDLLYQIPTKLRISVGWVPWDGPLGVGFCAGLLPSVPNNRAGFSYSGFARSRVGPLGGALGHDRSCLDMSEADGVDGGAICKRGFIHLQFAAKPEAPEAERHLGSRILE
ncbi:hypothetical protein V1477_017442 [Vespula maculifrons]|uniref:Uncharacterized protein n=1 Tax=Vespula maculifrons TaxID=7453 RepID=A0ABD2B642_VESMC